MDIDEFRRLSEEQIRQLYAPPLDDTKVEFLCHCLSYWEWDHEMKAYIGGIGSTLQAIVTGVLLATYSDVSRESQKKIVESINYSIDGYWTSFGEFTAAIVDHCRQSGADLVVEHCIKSLTFCKSLLFTMGRAEIDKPNWLEAIRKRIEKRDFVDDQEIIELEIDDCLAALNRLEASANKNGQ